MSGESAAEAELIACREKIEEHERQLRVLRAQLAQLVRSVACCMRGLLT